MAGIIVNPAQYLLGLELSEFDSLIHYVYRFMLAR